ncbi:site-specific DNA-methyltransferase [Calditerricola yamamurae]
MDAAMKKFQDLMRKLFEFDLADLDFGLYRLFHLKRTEIEAFITEQLPREVEEAFTKASSEDRERLQEELDKIAQEIRKNISEDAIQSDGSIAEIYRSIKLCQRYEEIRTRLIKLQVTEGHKAEVFNHLVNFFSRYYEDGDFIPKRRYGTRETYAVPYNGEEVFFYWANRDQHYVKTAERFRDYAFKVQDLTGEYRVRFTMAEASIPKDNTKGNTRYFFPRPDLAAYDAKAREFILPFEYRLPTPEELEQYGTTSKAQETILEESLPRILEAVPDANLRALLSRSADGSEEAPTILQKRLRHFCRRNTSDYFIHKNLRGFLTRELEFYIKDQIIHLMDLEGDLDAKRRIVRTFRKIAEKVIDFLATIEDAQKALFEKKKFVLETDYLIPVQHVPREFWPEILANQAQVAEWRKWLALEPQKDLFNQEGTINEAFLEAHPTLPLHTKHFDRDFVRRLLEALPFENLDEATDGLLVHSENYQALRLLLERYREQVKCVYIDPPYNSKTSEIMYKNSYKHSSWLSLIDGRISISKEFSASDGSHVIAIDENEQELLGRLLSLHFPENLYEKVCVSIVHNKKGIQGKYFSYNHDFAYFCIPKTLTKINSKPVPESEWEFDNLRAWGRESERETARNCFYPIYVENGEIVGFGEVCDDDFHPGQANINVNERQVAVYPVDSQGIERKWRYARDTIEQIRHLLKVHVTNTGEIQILKARSVKSFKTVWDDPKYIAGDYGTRWLTELGIKVDENLYPKSIHTVADSVYAVSNPSDLVLDFFAGSGTTGHAVINLNREDGGRRKFILVEMGEYFDTVLLPRIAKVMYTPEWKDGKPKREATPEEAQRTPRLVKILRLESYEDALHNLVAPSTLERAGQHEKTYKELAGEDAYRLRYWIELPLREAETCLRTLDLAHPFDYKLEILTDSGPVKKPVDVVETFNYLYGLRVRRYETWRNPEDSNREYRVVKAADRENKRRVLVLWRDMKDYDPKAERTFLEGKIVEMEAQGETWDEILINGDSPTPGVTSLDPLFKRLMMRGEEK